MGNLINYCIASEEKGSETVRKHVATEPSGHEFNDILLNDKNLPHNPLINAGAMSVLRLIAEDLSQTESFSKLLSYWKRLSGGRNINFDNITFLSEIENCDKNLAIGYLLKSRGAIP